MNNAPLSGIRVVACAQGAAAGYAMRLLATLGADCLLVEPEGRSALRRAAPFLPVSPSPSGEGLGWGLSADSALAGETPPPAPPMKGTEVSALFAYLSAGTQCQTGGLEAALAGADIFIDDSGQSLDHFAMQYPNLIPVSVLPFGNHGPKADWRGEDITLQHAAGEGYLLPNGLSVEMFPDRPPVKIGGHFAEYQGGIAAALAALTALWARPECGGQVVDISSQDAMLAVGAFAIQRLGDGSVEHRVERSFRFGGVIACADGYVELLTLEQRQWDGLVQLLGNPEWAGDPALADNIVRSRRGSEINGHIRAWAITRKVEDVVREGQKLSVPLAKYYTPAEVLTLPHAKARSLFRDDGMLTSPFHFDGAALTL